MKYYNENEILDNVSQPILLINRNYNIIDANQAFCKHSQRPLNKIIGQSCYNISHGYGKQCSQHSDMLCPTKIAFETLERSSGIHSRNIGGERILEAVVVTPIASKDYVIQEITDISKIFGLVEGILRICSICKNVCDDKGNWNRIESYVHDHTGADISHGICPKCYEKVCHDFLI